jgi:hypothetical protein
LRRTLIRVMRAPLDSRSLAIALILELFGCTASEQTSTSVPQSPTVSPPAIESPETAIFRRGCSSAIGGALPPNWRRLSVIAGPIAFIWLADGGSLSRRDLGNEGRGYVLLKVLVVLQQGVSGQVSVPSAERANASLLYDPSRFSPSGRYDFPTGTAVVRFEACAGNGGSWSTATQFNGGILAREPLCLHLDISTSESPGHQRRIQAPIGLSDCNRQPTEQH